MLFLVSLESLIQPHQPQTKLAIFIAGTDFLNFIFGNPNDGVQLPKSLHYLFTVQPIMLTTGWHDKHALQTLRGLLAESRIFCVFKREPACEWRTVC